MKKVLKIFVGIGVLTAAAAGIYHLFFRHNYVSQTCYADSEF